MEILAHVNKKRFVISKNNKFFLVVLRDKEAEEIEDPATIYRQGFWEEFKEKDPEIESQIKAIIG